MATDLIKLRFIGCMHDSGKSKGSEDELASTVAFSGTYFSDERQVVIPGAMYWPEYGLTNKFTTVVVWGGEEDVYMPFLSFNSAALNTIDYLNTLGHDVIGCNHGGAHSLPPDFTGEQVVEFFKDHPMGSHPTPYAGDGLPEDFPGYCELHAAE